MADEMPKENGCMSWVVPLVGAWAVMTGIETFAGRPAAMWFGIGFIVAALSAFWEAGRKAQS